jgi:serine phosphatase RsbU (regulator of sigma subunit)
VIGDVCGHGPDEAALGVCLRIAWRTLIMAGVPAGDVLARLQDVLVAERHADHVFTTVCMVSLAPGAARAEVRLAGHPPPLLLADGDAATLAAGPPGPPLGILDDAAWPAFALGLPAVWSLLLYTDGVTDGRVGAGSARLGDGGLAEVVAAAQAGAEDRPGELVRLVVERAEDLNGGPLADDVALVLMARRAS